MQEDKVRLKSSELIDLIDQADLGLLPWTEFTRHLAGVVPGATAVFMQNHRNPHYDSFAQHGFSPELLDAYNEYYGARNPWFSFWNTAPSGVVCCSSQTMPASSFGRSEFYNDWLAKLDRRFDGIGMKFELPSEASLMLIMQLPDRQLDRAEQILAPIITNIRSALARAVSSAVLRRDLAQKSAAAAVILERTPDFAFVLDGELTVVDANDKAESLLSSGLHAKSVNNKLNLTSVQAQQWLQGAIHSLAQRQPLPQHRVIFRLGPDMFRLSVFRVPEQESGARLLLFHRSLVLLLLRKIDDRSGVLDAGSLQSLYGLTPSELRLCDLLVRGETLIECGDRLGITRETARHRLKQIFQKTGVGSQVQLIALLARLL